MSAISWNGLESFTAPASTSTASSGDDWFRSFLSSVALGIGTSFIWPGSGGGSAASGGVSQLGNLRFARAGNSAVSGGMGDGYILLNTNHVSLHHIGSQFTAMLTHSSMEDLGTGVNGIWSTQTGSFSLDSTAAGVGDSGSTSFSFPTPYSRAPAWIGITTVGNDATTAFAVSISTATAGGFTSFYSGLKSGESTVNVFWESLGTFSL